ncbi:MAG: rod shape-determining protein MreD [Trueperaceae bacterium]
MRFRLFVFYFLLLVIQGFLGALLAPWPAPDLFLLALMTLMWRLQAWQLVLAGYGIGLFQDLIGHGEWGIHAFGLAGAAMVTSLLRAQLSQRGLLTRSLLFAAAFLGKWLAITPFVLWQTGTVSSLESILEVMPTEFFLTLLASLIVLPWGDALMERTLLVRRNDV